MNYIPWPEFNKLFRAFSDYTFRLETLTQYLVPGEDSDWTSFQRGDLLPPVERNSEWREMISDNVRAGKSVSRVHLWPDNLTPYLRYELHWGYLYNATAGDDIRLLLSSAPQEVRDACKDDFWIFDDKLVIVMDYEKDGTIIGAREMTEAARVPQYIDVMKLVLKFATPLRDYLKMTRMGEIKG